MTKPKCPKKGHAFLVMVGGSYGGSILSRSVITKINGSLNINDKNDIIELKFSGDIDGDWAFGWGDIHWTKTKNIKTFHHDITAELSKPVRKAIDEYEGAWVFRVYAK